MMTVRNLRIIGIITLILVSVMLCQNTQGKIIYVDDDDAAGANDGTNWGNAYVYLQDALADANDSEKPVEIRVAQGIYTPDYGNGTIPGDQEATFVLKSGLTLKGGFAGVGTDDPDAWDHLAYETVLSGDLSDNDTGSSANSAENSAHVIWCVEADATAVLDSFTITGGYASGGVGGGMYNDYASPTVRHCVFLDNYASTGGGMYNNWSNPTITDCTFSGNRAMGGGMYNHESHPLLISCIFQNNRGSLGGGGMNCTESNPTLINCFFVDNSSSFGGGIYSWKGGPILINCTFYNNRTPNGWGAGIHSEVGGHTIVTNCIVWGNSPDQIRAMGGGRGGNSTFSMTVSYSDVEGGYAGESNIDLDPLFADPDAGDYHLKSQAGRWDPVNWNWVIDLVTSPCVDGGDPNSPIEAEPFPHGDVVNMGFYGGTAEASMSLGYYTKYTAGAGEPNNPYQIATAEDLILLGDSPEDYDKHFILAANIDLDPNREPNLPEPQVFDRAVIAPDTDDITDGFDGTPFTGVFNGNGRLISHMTIKGASYLGLFGQLGPEAAVYNLGLEAVDVNGTGDYVSSLVGFNQGGSIDTSYSTGIIIGGDYVGGLVGESTGHIIASYSICTVLGGDQIGGLAGQNDGHITTSYSAGMVMGAELSNTVGGLVGSGSGNATGSFWDVEASGQVSSASGTGLTTAEMQTAGTFLAVGWDFVDKIDNGTDDIWWILEGFFYPQFVWEPRLYGGGSGTSDDPFQIATVADLMLLSETPEDNDKHFILCADIDLDPSLPGRKVFNRAVIGEENAFTGVFDGNDYAILHLTIEGERSLGLFASLADGAQVRDLGIVDVDIFGSYGSAGALAASCRDSHIVNCYSTGTVTASQNVGGLVGYHWGHYDEGIRDSYSTCTVAGTSDFLCNIGGLVGENDGYIRGCYSTGTVTGDQYLGGLVGRNFGGRIEASYSTGTVSGISSYIGGLVGDNYGSPFAGDCIIATSYSTGAVSGGSSMGGLVGRNWGGEIKTSYSSGQVSGTGGYIGGLLGENRDGTITNSYSMSAVSGNRDTGGLVGYDRYGRSTVTTSFWDMQISGRTTSDGGTGKTTAEMKAAATFILAGWGCSGVWTVNDGHDYPRLSWENSPGELLAATLDGLLAGEGTQASPYLVYTAEDAALTSSFPCEQDKVFRLMFLDGDGTPENPYLIHSAEEIDILNIYPLQYNVSFRLMFVEGEGTQESPYLIKNAEEINLLKTCPYEQNAHFKLRFVTGEGMPEDPYVINTIEEMEILKTCPYEQDASYRLGFVEGEGTPESPYLIFSSDELDLMGLSPYELDKHFKLMVDIDMSGILYSGAVIPNFAGNFDGNDLTISNLTIKGGNSLGLFRRLDSGAEVKDLGVVDVNITGSGGTIGALAAYISSSNIVNCYSTGTVTGDRDIGGLVGHNGGSITTSFSTCTVTSTSGYLCNVGGLVGEDFNGSIAGSYSAGTVTGTEYVGGLVGRNHHGGRITTSYSTATVNGTGGYIGGLVGDNYAGGIVTSYSNGTVSGGNSVGGLVGANRSFGSIGTSYSSAAVSGRGNVGGLVGENHHDCTVAMSYSAGMVSGTGISVGGLVGEDWGGDFVTACFWDMQTSGQTTSAGGTGQTTAEMQTATAFLEAGWDFVDETVNGTDDIWWILEGQDYPRQWWDKYRTLTVSSGAHGSVTEPGEGSFIYDRGTVVPIQAMADEGYALVHWTGTGVDAGRVETPSVPSTTVILDGNYTLKAVFGQARVLTLSSGVHGSVTVPGEGLFQYGEGSVAAIKASPNPGYRFVRWIGTAVDAGQIANPRDAETEVTIDTDYTVQALFAPFSPIYVDSVATGANDGSSWTNAYESLQDALTTALPGSEILVAQGVFHPDRGTGWTRGDRTAAFELRNDVTIRGGYAGLGTPDPDEWNTDTFVTLLSGDLDDNDTMGIAPAMMMQDPTRAENSYHVLVGDAGNENAMLEGLTITGGHADGNDPNSKGGGMYLYESNPTLLSCRFIANSGGYTVYTDPYKRRIYGGGGGLYNDHSSPTLINCTFHLNATGANGGGMHNDDQSDPSLTDCSFVNNFSEDSGAGMYNQSSSPKLMGCVFSNNSAEKAAAGMYNNGSNPSLISCGFSHNQAQYNGGAVFNDSSSPKMVNCVFNHNTTPAFGGAMSNEQGGPELINCTFCSNSASHGGAIYTNGPMKILNCILWYDTPNEIGSKGTSVAVNYSNIQGGWQGNNISLDPLFVNSTQGDCHLRAGSPCINQGNNTELPKDTMDLDGDLNTTEAIPWDFDGNPRVVGNVVDMGAYELSVRRGR